MRLIVFFDLPSVTNSEKRRYRKFKKFLDSEGFLMMQESVYCKLTMNYTSCETVIERLKKNKPADGIVQCLVITEKQYSEIYYITGEKKSSQLDTTNRITEI